MRRRLALVASAALFSLVVLSPGMVFALVCTPDGPPAPGTPLPGSCFEGYDGNQVDSDGSGAGNDRLDWQSIIGITNSVSDNPSGNSDSQFGAGGNELTPDNWTFDFGSLGSDKYDILSGYVAQEPGTGDALLALGFIRGTNNGTTHLAFELNQREPGYRTTVETHSGRLIEVPTRTTGDLLITYSVDPPVIGLCRWSGNEHAGQWLDFAGTSVSGSNCPLPPQSLVQGAMNAAAIPAAQNFLQGGALDAKTFAEGSINLTDAMSLFNAGDSCFTFTFAWLHSRSSIAITSNQQDLILPAEGTTISDCPPPPPSIAESVEQSVEQSVAGGTGAPSLPNAATAPSTTGGMWVTLGFAALLIASLGALAVANLGVVRRRR